MNKNIDIFGLSPFSSPRAKVDFKKFAIFLTEPRNDFPENPNSQSARITSALAKELMPKLRSKVDEMSEDDIVGRMGEILQEKIRSHAGVDAAILTSAEIVKQHGAALAPLMYRIATEDFIKTCRNEFKIIECRNATKLVSDWKPSLPDTLIALKHQVIVVQLKGTFLSYNDFAYSVLRQLDHGWKLRMPRSLFYPNDVCTVEKTQDRDLIIVTPSMPDGDLEVSRKMSTLNYELIMMFKRSCIGAMKNYLLMRDLRIGRFQDTEYAVAAIRSIYKKVQDQLRGGQELRLGTVNCEELYEFMKDSEAGPVTSETVIEYGKRLGFVTEHEDHKDGDGDKNKGSGDVKSQKSLRSQDLLGKLGSSGKGDGDRLQKMLMSKSISTPRSARHSAREPLLKLDHSVLDEKLNTKFNRIQSLISEDSNPIDSHGGGDTIQMEKLEIGKTDKK